MENSNKDFGPLYCLSSILTLWQSLNITIEYSSLTASFNHYSSNEGITITICLVLSLVYILMVYCCLFKTDWLINKLRLDEGYQEELFDFDIQQTVVAKIAIIIFGGLLVINTTSEVIIEIVIYFQKPGPFELHYLQRRNLVYMIADLIKIAFGLFMLTCSRIIINFMVARKRKAVTGLPEE